MYGHNQLHGILFSNSLKLKTHSAREGGLIGLKWLTGMCELATAAALCLASSALEHGAPLYFILPTSATPTNIP